MLANIKVEQKYISNSKTGILSFFLDELPTSPLTVNYTVSGATDKVDLVAGSIVFQTNEIEKTINVNKTSTVTGIEDLLVSLTTGTGYDIYRSEATLRVSETFVKAFPTAEGAGAYTTGGRGGLVYHVTNLNSDGAGSFREGVEGGTQNGVTFTKTTPRTIVFDVSGTIIAEPRIEEAGVENLTIAGQTAPQGGISIQTAGISLTSGKNMIVRYIRSVNTNAFSGSTQRLNCFNFSGSNDIIVDHCSMRYTHNTIGFLCQENNHTKDGQNNITLQRSVVGDCLTGALVGGSVTVPRMYLGGKNSVHHNLFAHVDHRFPNVSGVAEAEVVENIAYNYRSRFNQFFNDSKSNLINNTFKAGSSSIFGASRFNSIAVYGGLGIYTPKVYMSGNRIDSDGGGYDHLPTDTDMQGIFKIWAGTSPDSYVTPTATDEANYRVNTPYQDLGVPITQLGTDVAYDNILNDVGANAYLNDDGTVGTYLDEMDANYINDTTNGTNWYGGTQYVNKTDVNALVYPTLPSNTRTGYYVSNPHIPEAYLDARASDLTAAGISKTDADVHNTIMPSGTTLMDDFLNEVDTGNYIVKPVITLIGQATLQLTVDDTYIEQGATAIDGDDGDITNSIVIAGDTVDTSVIGNYVITYTVQDSDQNETVVSRVVNVSAGAIPIITVANEVSITPSTNYIEFSEDISDDYWQKVRLTIESNSDIINSINENSTKLIATNSTNYHTLKVELINSNTSEFIMRAKKGTVDYVQFINIETTPFSVATFNLDTGVASIFSGTGFSNLTMEDIGDGFYKCKAESIGQGDLFINITNGDNDGNVAMTTADNLFVGGIEQKNIDYEYIPTNGGVVTVDGIGFNTVIQGQTYVDDGATALDNQGNSITVTTTGTVDTNTVGTYILTYNATDSFGNQAIEKTREVRVIASNFTIPTITRTDNNPIVYNIGDTFLGVTGTYSDDDGNGDASVNLGNLDMNTAGVYNVTLFHTDTDGNTGSLIVPITVLADTGNIIFDLTPEQIAVGKNMITLLSKIIQ